MSVAPEARGRTAGKRVCRVCGCTEWYACLNLFGDPCHWIEADLCSACMWEVAPYRGAFRVAPRAAFAGAGATGFTRGAP